MTVDVAHIRPPRIQDAEALCAVYAEAWQGAYQGVIPHLSLQRMLSRRGLRWWKDTVRSRSPLLVLEFDREAAGYVTCGRSRLGGSPFQGEIFELYLHPVYQGLGLGGMLFKAARGRLCELRLKGLIVWALADNDAATSFYARLGGRPVAEGSETFDKVTLRKLAFAWS